MCFVDSHGPQGLPNALVTGEQVLGWVLTEQILSQKQKKTTNPQQLRMDCGKQTRRVLFNHYAETCERIPLVQ